MLLFPNALCCSLYRRNCVCAVTKIFTKFLPANNFCQLLRVTRKSSCTSAGNAQAQLHFRDDQQRAFGISNISNSYTPEWDLPGMGSDCNNYRLITAYLLLRVNLDKIMHARWDFDASSARTRRVSALDKHQNWSASVLFCLNSRAQSKYAVVNLIHTRRKQTFFVFYHVINKTL